MKFVFIDTNTYVHYRFFDEIDWPSIVEAEQVQIVVTQTIVGELDKLKYTAPSAKDRQRVKKVIKKLYDFQSKATKTKAGLIATINNNTGIEFQIFSSIPDRVFTQYTLDQSSYDDKIIASVLTYEKPSEEDQIILVTADLGFSLKANHLAIETIALPDRYQLEPELSQLEKRIKHLEKENLEFRNRLPKIKLLYKDGEPILKKFYESPISKDGLDSAEFLENLKSKYPKLDPPKQDTYSSSIDNAITSIRGAYGSTTPSILPREIDSYNKTLDHFYRELVDYYSDEIDFLNYKNRSILVQLKIINEGTCPAEDIDVHLHFPDGFELYDFETLPIEIPEEPKPPQKPQPQTMSDRMQVVLPTRSIDMSSLTPPPSLTSISPPSNVSSPNIQRSNSYDVTLHVQSLKHGMSEEVEPMIVVFDSIEAISSFKIEYRLMAANLPRPVTGALHVVVVH